MERGSGTTILVCALVLAATPASAQEATPLERGRALTENADFEGALVALNEADATALDRAQRVELYSSRALVHYALGDHPAADSDLARLLAMGANASLPDSAPPPLRERLEALRREGVRPPVIVARARVEDGVARIDAEAEGGADLLRGVRVWIREGEWRASPRVERPLAEDAALQWFAEAYGPGDVRLATDGTRARPNVLSVHVEEAVLTLAADSEQSDDDAILWGVLGGGAGALAVAAGIIAAVLLTSAGDGTQLSGPVLVP